MTYIEQNIPEEQWNRLTQKEKHRLEKHLCLKCGKKITEATFHGSLCRECDSEYFDFFMRTPDSNDYDGKFLEFIRAKEQVQFT